MAENKFSIWSALEAAKSIKFELQGMPSHSVRKVLITILSKYKYEN